VALSTHRRADERAAVREVHLPVHVGRPVAGMTGRTGGEGQVFRVNPRRECVLGDAVARPTHTAGRIGPHGRCVGRLARNGPAGGSVAVAAAAGATQAGAVETGCPGVAPQIGFVYRDLFHAVHVVAAVGNSIVVIVSSRG